jgi:hypothetical protein
LVIAARIAEFLPVSEAAIAAFRIPVIRHGAIRPSALVASDFCP